MLSECWRIQADYPYPMSRPARDVVPNQVFPIGVNVAAFAGFTVVRGGDKRGRVIRVSGD